MGLVTLKETREFQRLFKKGKSVVTYGFVCYYLENNRENRGSLEHFGANRLGIVASKKVGNAVKRNRAKRIIREGFRLWESQFRETTDKRYDFVFVARGKTPELKMTQVYKLINEIRIHRLD
jgi:ribonuclease P protein component